MRAPVYPGAALPTGGALSLRKPVTRGRANEGHALLPRAALSPARGEISRTTFSTRSENTGVDTHIDTQTRLTWTLLSFQSHAHQKAVCRCFSGLSV